MIGVGVLLLVAAGLKFAGMAFSPVPAVGEFSSPRLGIAIAAWELLLGIWLIAKWEAGWSLVLATLTFAAFAAVSGYFTVIGVSNCGCLGAVKTNPRVMLTLDSVVLLLLLAVRPTFCSLIGSPTRQGKALAFSAVAILGTVITAIVAHSSFSSVRDAVARFRGEPISLSSQYLDFGGGPPGKSMVEEVGITNHGDANLRIIGGTSDCSCTVFDSLPLTIAPGETGKVLVKLTIPKVTSGQMTRKVMLRTDSSEYPMLRFKIGCIVE
jgi:hypothetical protein